MYRPQHTNIMTKYKKPYTHNKIIKKQQLDCVHGAIHLFPSSFRFRIDEFARLSRRLLAGVIVTAGTPIVGGVSVRTRTRLPEANHRAPLTFGSCSVIRVTVLVTLLNVIALVFGRWQKKHSSLLRHIPGGWVSWMHRVSSAQKKIENNKKRALFASLFFN